MGRLWIFLILNLNIWIFFLVKFLKKIKNNEAGWDEHLPEGISEMIVKKKMFGYNPALKKIKS